MLTLPCLVMGCKKRAIDTDEDVVVALYNAHSYTHTVDAGRDQGSSQRKNGKLDRPRITQGASIESWDSFKILWRLYKQAADLSETEYSLQLMYCCSKELREQLFRTDPRITARPEEEQIKSIGKLAVVSHAMSETCSKLLSISQKVGGRHQGLSDKEQVRKYRQNAAESAARVPLEVPPEGRQECQRAKVPKCRSATRGPPMRRQKAIRDLNYANKRCSKTEKPGDYTNKTAEYTIQLPS